MYEWYNQWTPYLVLGTSVSGGACIGVTGSARTVEQLMQLPYDVSVDCMDDVCVAAATSIANNFYKLSVPCMGGITTVHKDSLATALHPDACKGPTPWYTEWVPYAVMATALYVHTLALGACAARGRR